MFCLVKHAFRAVVIGGLVLGAATLGTRAMIGSERTDALMGGIQEKLHAAIDRHIDEPTALRAQLKELESQYPDRIAQLSGDLAEVREQIARTGREQAVALRVVELAERDLLAMGQGLPAENGLRPASYGGALLPGAQQLEARRQQIQQTKLVYHSRASDAARESELLAAQQARLEEALGRLQHEQTEFQAKLTQIEGQVDAIARNRRLIEMMEQRQKSLEEASRYEAVSLDHLTAKLDEVRSRQEAELDVLASSDKRVDYEDQARLELEQEQEARRLIETIHQSSGLQVLPGGR
jgi:hypothetical protein